MLAGAISAIYIGPATEEAPIAKPPIKRPITSTVQLGAKAVKTDVRVKMKAIAIITFFLPYRSAGNPAEKAPTTAPMMAMATVKPCQKFVKWYKAWTGCSTPEITAVSK